MNKSIKCNLCGYRNLPFQERYNNGIITYVCSKCVFKETINKINEVKE
jgi:DNA-directed RNA polymerase subunit RPC12/RpoP